ncbi:hypothetical protein [Acidocella sp.]|jgi:hypothetical protein|uniref:hypothetical protein n=1 Tax=Acidocella sp. TaxID=50710 RepID=UPI002F3F072D
MREIHGIADAKRVMMVGQTDDTAVTVSDGANVIFLSIPAEKTVGLTPEQARFIAKQLIEAACRKDPKNVR